MLQHLNETNYIFSKTLVYWSFTRIHSVARNMLPSVWSAFKMAGQRGDVMVMSSAADLPLSHPAIRMSAGLV